MAVPMDFLLQVDLDWLCIAAEFAAALLLLSFAWQPPHAMRDAGDGPGVIDWEPLQFAHIQAVTAAGRSIALRFNVTDEARLRELQAALPSPFRDRLTGTWNANGMDRLIIAWSDEPELRAYPSCYGMIAIESAEELLARRGAACVEQALKSLAELLFATLGDCAIISRYHPNRFVLHLFGKSSAQCEALFAEIGAKAAEPHFSQFGDDSISLQCRATCWSCNRGVEPDELIDLLEEGRLAPAPTEAVMDKPLANTSKPFSIDDLAPFPCPWDDPPEDPLAAAETASEEEHVEEETQDPWGQEADEPWESVEGDDMEASREAGNVAKVRTPNIGPAEKRVKPIQPFEKETGVPREVEGSDAEDAIVARERLRVTGPMASQTVEGFASPEQIEDLLNQLSDVDKRQENDVVASEPPSPAPSVPELEPPGEAPKGRSIYTDDIEESLLKDDLASLFAAVRSSAVGDFGYPEPEESASKPEGKGKLETDAPAKPSGKEPPPP